ncbi:putative acetyltransferase [Specibacter sp. RAF43]|uniref:putative acetyltransferase n=1 Tax=Specibacter sp. RAF43 TaxID=3233057 RepID=UPI003F9CD9BC
MSRAVETLKSVPLGTRMVVRYRIEAGSTDALGELTARDAATCTVATRSGPEMIAWDDVQLAKPVPPPPPRRARRVPH